MRECTHDFESLSEALLLGACLVLSEVALRLASETLVRVSTANGTVGFVEDLLGLLENGSEVLDQGILVTIIFALGLERLDFL